MPVGYSKSVNLKKTLTEFLTEMLSAALELLLWASASERERPQTKISLKRKVTVVIVELVYLF